MRTVAPIVCPRIHSGSRARLGNLAVLLVAASIGLVSCRWKEAGVIQPPSLWERIGIPEDAPDPWTLREVESILLWATDSLAPSGDLRSRWNVYCHEDISWSRTYRIEKDVHPGWMDDSWYIQIAFPTGAGLRLHFGNPGIAVPVYSDPRDTAMEVRDGNVDTAAFHRRKLPCRHPGPTDFRGIPFGTPGP